MTEGRSNKSQWITHDSQEVLPGGRSVSFPGGRPKEVVAELKEQFIVNKA
jgi:hypothetical protein